MKTCGHKDSKREPVSPQMNAHVVIAGAKMVSVTVEPYVVTTELSGKQKHAQDKASKTFVEH